MFTLHCEVDIESTLEYNRQESSELFKRHCFADYCQCPAKRSPRVMLERIYIYIYIYIYIVTRQES